MEKSIKYLLLRTAMSDKKQKPAKKHHILPQSYLKRFGTDDKVFILNFLNEHNENSYQASIVKATVIKDFYTVETINKRDRDFVEQKLLCRVESGVAPIIDKMLKTNSLPRDKEWENLAFFIALMFLRGPWFRDMIHKHFASRDELVLKKSLELIPEWGDYFCKMTPNLLFMPFINEARFITSDVPVIPCSRKANLPKDWIRRQDTDIYFPLSPQACLLLNYDKLRKVSEASRKKIAFINRILADKCTRILVSKNQDFIWMRDNRAVSYSSEELVKFLGEKKKSQARIKTLVEKK